VTVGFALVPQDPAEPHEWSSIIDPDGTTWLFDITFLMSGWTCIWGRGCPGIHDEPHPELEQGCCTYGAHFADKADRQRVLKYTDRLSPTTWQYSDEADRLGGPVWKNEEGDWVTHVVDGACIYYNRPGFSAGSGCALHSVALAEGERYIDWKPEVCWQLPLRLEHHYDDNSNLVYTIREWKRRDWGEGGGDLHWWCVDTPDAFVGDRPVYLELREEIIELVGEWPYAHLVEYLERRRREVPLPHPVLKSTL
jgi:hypothetical protein